MWVVVKQEESGGHWWDCGRRDESYASSWAWLASRGGRVVRPRQWLIERCSCLEQPPKLHGWREGRRRRLVPCPFPGGIRDVDLDVLRRS